MTHPTPQPTKQDNTAMELRNQVEVSDTPTAVTVKPVLALIQAHCSGDKQEVKKRSLEIAHELELNNKEQLALYIYAQFGLVNTFEVTD